MKAVEWWKTDPVRFQCQSDCIKCCSKPGVVYFSDEDISAAAKYLRLSPGQFKLKYLVQAGDTWYADLEDSPCPFLLHNGCHIHSAKPQQCRSFPFWRENLMSRKHWKATGMDCPGVDVGPRISPEAIKDFLHDEI